MKRLIIILSVLTMLAVNHQLISQSSPIIGERAAIEVVEDPESLDIIDGQWYGYKDLVFRMDGVRLEWYYVGDGDIRVKYSWTRLRALYWLFDNVIIFC